MHTDNASLHRRVPVKENDGTNIQSAYTAPATEAAHIRPKEVCLPEIKDVTNSKTIFIIKFIKKSTSAYTISFNITHL